MKTSRDTSKSDKIVQRYQHKPGARKVLNFSVTLEATVEELFPLLCPTREADWIPGWDCDLVYTGSGYAEDKCVFVTGKSNSVGDGVWTFTGYEQNERVEFVRLQENVLWAVKIAVADNGDGTATATWRVVATALNERGNRELEQISGGEQRANALGNMLRQYLSNGADTSKSNQLLQKYRQKELKLKRSSGKFSVTLDATVQELFPLFCPAREADWIPGWDCKLIYTESGYAENKCVFMTDESNSAGAGTWTFVGFEENKYVKFVRYQVDVLTSATVSVADNGDGTVSATWDVVTTALTARGNQQVENMSDHGGPLGKMLAHYLKTGKTINVASLAVGTLHDAVKESIHAGVEKISRLH
jgi:hypothetical protein